MFFIASIVKFVHGGYVVAILATMILFVMAIWHRATQLTFKYIKSLNINDYKPQLDRLRKDATYDLYQTNVVYLTSKIEGEWIDRSILYSLLDRRPKRSEVYWLVNIKVTDEPYTSEYSIETFDTDYIVSVTLYLGFRMRQEVRYLRTIVTDLMDSGRLPR
jgi:KUP system potassium uptake protein